VCCCNGCCVVGIFDWDLSLKARTDGTFGLEGLKYGSPRDYADGAAAATGGAEASGGAAVVGPSASGVVGY
jgi:hypothetical protein